jgi:retrograde regulation protein 2
MQDPLQVATSPFARPSADVITTILLSAIPDSTPTTGNRRFPPRINVHVIHALANGMYVHQVMSKESASTAALYSTSTGLLSSVHGISHVDRALMALMLEARYEGELPPRETKFKADLMALLTAEEAWWVGYLGKIAYMISRLYPSGFVDAQEPRVALKAEWVDDLGREGKEEGLRLVVSIHKQKNDPMKLAQALRDHKGVIEKGKRKNWIGGKKGRGKKVKVKIVEVDY